MRHKTFFSRRLPVWPVVFGLLLCINLSCTVKETIPTNSYTYNLPSNSSSLYPDASWLPDAYKKYYPDLATTIQEYTQQSLLRGELANTKASVSIGSDGSPSITLTGSDDLAAMQAFAGVQQAFLNQSDAVQGLQGVTNCQNTPNCWDTNTTQTYPWAFFLPLGMAMTNQALVNFMNYPPAVSLEQKDYLNNNTMKRWSGVLQAVGIQNPVLYETIVNGRPIAAAGSNLKKPLPDITTYFNSAGNDYVTPMISLLSQSNTAGYTLPVTVLGAPAGQDWAKVINVPSVKPGDVGVTTVISSGKKTAWVAGNHPNVTSYQCCPGDPSKDCQAHDGYPVADKLIPDEQTDLMVACIEQGLATGPAADPNVVKAQCTTLWNSPVIPPANQAALCVRARLDYSWNGIGNCKTTAEAEDFCNRHADNACATNAGGGALACNQ